VTSIEAIVADPASSVPQKSERVTAAFYALPDHGAAQATETLRTTTDPRVAAFAADYLALLPGHQAEKNRAAERLRTAPPLAGAAARLVSALEPALLRRFIDDYRAAPDKRSPLYSVMFEIAMFHPALLRPHRELFDSPSIRRGLLSGGPDHEVDEHVARWRAARDPEALDAMARFRTPKAAAALQNLRGEVEDASRWEGGLEMAGRLPDGSPAIHTPSFLGFVVEDGKTPHRMGGTLSGQVPVCPVCSKPAERVLTLAAPALPYGLSADPSFFWYPCGCNSLDFATVQERPDGRRIFFSPAGAGGAGGHVIPAPCSLELEPHPNQAGVSIDASGGFARHQVGGHPAWIRPRPLPYCPVCQVPMRFLASVDSGMTPFGPTGFTGTLFGFWCGPCAVATTLRQA
jgi:hypothetical protein